MACKIVCPCKRNTGIIILSINSFIFLFVGILGLIDLYNSTPYIIPHTHKNVWLSLFIVFIFLGIVGVINSFITCFDSKKLFFDETEHIEEGNIHDPLVPSLHKDNNIQYSRRTKI